MQSCFVIVPRVFPNFHRLLSYQELILPSNYVAQLRENYCFKRCLKCGLLINVPFSFIIEKQFQNIDLRGSGLVSKFLFNVMWVSRATFTEKLKVLRCVAPLIKQ